MIALKTHWSRAEIRSMPAAEFNHALNALTLDKAGLVRYREALKALAKEA